MGICIFSNNGSRLVAEQQKQLIAYSNDPADDFLCQ